MINYLKRLASLIIPAILFIVLSAAPAHAVYFASGNNQSLSKDKKFNETVIISGNTLMVDSEINGDLICAGRDIIINSNIKGDVICAGQNIKINGIVDGNIRAAGQSIDITGSVSRNVTVASQTLSFGKTSSIKGDTFFGVQNIDLSGAMGRDLAGAGEQIKISGSLLRNAIVTVNRLDITDTSKIGGNLDYYMTNEGLASVSAKTVKGTVTKHEIATPEKREMNQQIKTVTKTAKAISMIISILGFIVIGLVILYFNRSYTIKTTSVIRSKPLATFFVGFGALIAAPIVFIILAVTVIGAPLSLVTFLFYILSLVMASVYTSFVVGKLVLGSINKKEHSPYLVMTLGVTILGILFALPLVGWLIKLIALCTGLGGIFLVHMPEKK